MKQSNLLRVGEAAEQAGCSAAYLKRLAEMTGLDQEIHRQGRRKDWQFTPDQVRQLSGFLKKED